MQAIQHLLNWSVLKHTTDAIWHEANVYHATPICMQPELNVSVVWHTQCMTCHEAWCMSCIVSKSHSLCKVYKHAQLHRCKATTRGTPDYNDCLVRSWLPAMVPFVANIMLANDLATALSVQQQQLYVLAAATPVRQHSKTITPLTLAVQQLQRSCHMSSCAHARNITSTLDMPQVLGSSIVALSCIIKLQTACKTVCMMRHRSGTYVFYAEYGKGSMQ
jgi:hypothetical protein